MSIHKNRETKNMGTVIGVIIVIMNVIKRHDYRNYDDRNHGLCKNAPKGQKSACTSNGTKWVCTPPLPLMFCE